MHHRVAVRTQWDEIAFGIRRSSSRSYGFEVMDLDVVARIATTIEGIEVEPATLADRPMKLDGACAVPRASFVSNVRADPFSAFFVRGELHTAVSCRLGGHGAHGQHLAPPSRKDESACLHAY